MRIDLHVNTDVGYDDYRNVEIFIDDSHGITKMKGALIKIGGFSRNFPKNSYSIQLDSSISIIGHTPGKSWILNSSYIDKTFIRHRLSFDFFRRMRSSNVAPKSFYADLFIDGSREGIYIVMENIDAAYLDIDLQDPNAFYCKECPVFRKDFLTQDSMNYEVTIESAKDRVRAIAQI